MEEEKFGEKERFDKGRKRKMVYSKKLKKELWELESS